MQQSLFVSEQLGYWYSGNKVLVSIINVFFVVILAPEEKNSRQEGKKKKVMESLNYWTDVISCH